MRATVQDPPLSISTSKRPSRPQGHTAQAQAPNPKLSWLPHRSLKALRPKLGFPLCDTILEKALEPSNAVRDGKGSYQGLAKLKVKHNDCRGRQEEKKIQYDMCNDQKENEQQLMTASCDQNFTKFYQKAGATTTGQWGATCDTKQSTYQQNAPADIPLIHQPPGQEQG
ncbi:unnamed protein product [Symbiodinium necroappetens]|uniref:Uncharacterized protein n=1 Tax=Symbiodinium necroappetens TaxID=1628268 RepID=A0A813BUC3_9DINO|nr:unnamed protein product [Symbiodinium necroappetens]